MLQNWRAHFSVHPGRLISTESGICFTIITNMPWSPENFQNLNHLNLSTIKSIYFRVKSIFTDGTLWKIWHYTCSNLVIRLRSNPRSWMMGTNIYFLILKHPASMYAKLVYSHPKIKPYLTLLINNHASCITFRHFCPLGVVQKSWTTKIVFHFKNPSK